jgi:hypothetical protein
MTIDHFTVKSRVFPSVQTVNNLLVAAGTKASELTVDSGLIGLVRGIFPGLFQDRKWPRHKDSALLFTNPSKTRVAVDRAYVSVKKSDVFVSE